MRPLTTEYDDDDAIRRTLSPAMWAAVIVVTALARDVDTQYVYTTTTDGPTSPTSTDRLDVVNSRTGPRLVPAAHPHRRRDGNPSAPCHRDAIARSLLLDGPASAH
jgi:hypothetical protein